MSQLGHKKAGTPPIFTVISKLLSRKQIIIISQSSSPIAQSPKSSKLLLLSSRLQIKLPDLILIKSQTTHTHHSSCVPPTFSPSSPPSWPSELMPILSTSQAAHWPSKSAAASALSPSRKGLRAPTTVTACRCVATVEGLVALRIGKGAPRCLVVASGLIETP